MKFFLSTIIIFIFTSLNVLNAKELKIDEIKNLNSKVFFMRHALAPGFGDPENFNLETIQNYFPEYKNEIQNWKNL